MVKSKVSKECIDTAAEALALFTDSELSQYVRDVYTRAKSYDDGTTGMAAIDRAQKEINDETLRSLFDDTKTKLDNVTKNQEHITAIQSKKITLRNLLAKRFESVGKNVGTFVAAAKNRLQQAGWGQLDKGLFEYLHTKENGLMIVRALDGDESSPEAKRVAKAVNDYLDLRTDMTVNSGALPLEFINDDRMFRHIHDASRLMSAGRSWAQMAKSRFKTDLNVSRGTWREQIKSLLDLQGTFEHTDAMGLDGGLDDSIIDQILNDIYDNITQGKNDIFSQSKIVNGAEEIKKKRRMFFKFNDWQSLLKYNEQYGTGDFFSMWERDTHGAASKIGSSELLGSNPTQAYFDLKKVQQEVDPEKGRFWFRNTDLYYQAAMGIDQSPVSVTLANIGANLRSIASAAALPLITLKSLPDVAHISAYAARWGVDYMNTHGYLMKHMFNALPAENRQYIAKLFKGMIHSDMGYSSRFVDSHNSSEIVKKYNMKFYRAMGLSAFDEGNKVSIMTLMADHLGTMSRSDFNGLNEDLQNQLLKHDITPNEWNYLRKKTQKGLFTTDNVTNLTDAEIRDIHEGSDKSIPLHQMRTRLYNKVFSVFEVSSENAVLSPGTFERAWLHQGTAPGTANGELMRCFAQFKAFPIAFMDRVLLNGYRNAEGSQAKMAFALKLAISTLPLSVFSNGLSSLAQGLSWPDPREMSASELVKYGLDNIAGSMGIFLQIAEANKQNKGLVMSMLSSPSLQLAGDALSVPAALATGHLGAAEKAFKDAAFHIVPGKQLIGWSPYMQKLLDSKPYMEPGQHLLRQS